MGNKKNEKKKLNIRKINSKTAQNWKRDNILICNYANARTKRQNSCKFMTYSTSNINAIFQF